MAKRCGCASDFCSCVISPAGDGIEVSGHGSQTDPYIINLVAPAVDLVAQDDNVTIVSNVNSLDFRGSGVVVTTGTTGEAIVTVPGTGEAAAVGLWNPYTPTISGFATVGGSTATGRYTTIGKTCIANATLTIGTGFDLGSSGAKSVSLPLVMASANATCRITLVSTGVNTYGAHAAMFNNGIAAYAWHATLTTGPYAHITNTHPFVWKVGDIIYYAITYETTGVPVTTTTESGGV